MEDILPDCILDDDIVIDDDAPYFNPMDPDYVPTDNEDSSSCFVPLEDNVNVLSD